MDTLITLSSHSEFAVMARVQILDKDVVVASFELPFADELRLLFSILLYIIVFELRRNILKTQVSDVCILLVVIGHEVFFIE